MVYRTCQQLAGNCLCELFTVHRTWLAIVYVSVYSIQDMAGNCLCECLWYTGHVSCLAGNCLCECLWYTGHGWQLFM